jgi:hypothetical protein
MPFDAALMAATRAAFAVPMSTPFEVRMPLGMDVTLAMLSVIALLGVLGYLMDKQVDHDDRKGGRA